MPERKKLELELNKPAVLEMLFDDPVVGQSRYGDYYLYAVKNDVGEERSFFAPNEEVHKKLLEFGKGDKVQIVKSAKQNGKKVVTEFIVNGLNGVENEQLLLNQKSPETSPTRPLQDNYAEILLQSFEDAIQIQKKLDTMVDTTKLALSLFIARSKVNGNGIIH